MLHFRNKNSVPKVVSQLGIPMNDFTYPELITFRSDWLDRSFKLCLYPFKYEYRVCNHYTRGCVIDGIVYQYSNMGLRFYLLYRYKQLQYKISVEDIVGIQGNCCRMISGADFILILPSYSGRLIHTTSWCEDNDAKFALNMICRTLLNNPGKSAML